MKGLRSERLGGEFQKEITKVISQKLRNQYPELSAIVSVTEADVAADLKTAKVYVSIYDVDAERRAESFTIIRENAGMIRHELARVMTMRTVPELRFVLDDSAEYGSRIDTILNKLEQEHKQDDE